MRLDLFLKVTRLIKQRTVAKQACDAGVVTLNGDIAKPGSLVHPGDRLHIDLPTFLLDAEVLEVPSRSSIPRKDVERYVRVLEQVKRDPHRYVFGDDTDE
jgi:ribosomal 50S subunit-recycling heat shock protein